MVDGKYSYDKLGQWHTVFLKAQFKTIIIMIIYRILTGDANRVSKSLTQYNRRSAKVWISNEYRSKLLKEITTFLQQQTYDNVILAADWNEDIESNNI